MRDKSIFFISQILIPGLTLIGSRPGKMFAHRGKGSRPVPRNDRFRPKWALEEVRYWWVLELPARFNCGFAGSGPPRIISMHRGFASAPAQAARALVDWRGRACA